MIFFTKESRQLTDTLKRYEGHDLYCKTNANNYIVEVDFIIKEYSVCIFEGKEVHLQQSQNFKNPGRIIFFTDQISIIHIHKVRNGNHKCVLSIAFQNETESLHLIILNDNKDKKDAE